MKNYLVIANIKSIYNDKPERDHAINLIADNELDAAALAQFYMGSDYCLSHLRITLLNPEKTED